MPRTPQRDPERTREREPERPPERDLEVVDRDPVDDEVEVVDRKTGRRYRLRPAEPGRYDYLGFSWVAWTIFWIVVIGLIWWWAWAWT